MKKHRRQYKSRSNISKERHHRNIRNCGGHIGLLKPNSIKIRFLRRPLYKRININHSIHPIRLKLESDNLPICSLSSTKPTKQFQLSSLISLIACSINSIESL